MSRPRCDDTGRMLAIPVLVVLPYLPPVLVLAASFTRITATLMLLPPPQVAAAEMVVVAVLVPLHSLLRHHHNQHKYEQA